jgi:hypothetical protein
MALMSVAATMSTPPWVVPTCTVTVVPVKATVVRSEMRSRWPAGTATVRSVLAAAVGTSATEREAIEPGVRAAWPSIQVRTVVSADAAATVAAPIGKLPFEVVVTRRLALSQNTRAPWAMASAGSLVRSNTPSTWSSTAAPMAASKAATPNRPPTRAPWPEARA